MKDLIEKYNFNFKKKFGQNFLKDKNILENIALKSDIDKDTLVIEIGVGAAALTNVTCNYAKNVIGYEIDETLKPIINEVLGDKDNVEIIFTDFLKRNVNEDIKKYEYKKLYVVANLPYYITTPIIEKIIEDDLGVDKIVIMVQKEVGDRFRAEPNSKDYNSLSIYLNYYFDVRKIMDVSRNVFMPKPNVDSIVVEFSKKEKKLELIDEQIFFKLIKDSFTQKRKNLRNNLKNYDLLTVENVLKKYNFDLNARAEQLPINIFVEIANSLVMGDKHDK